jgi:hypothetical protein
MALQQDPNVAKTFFIPSDKVGGVVVFSHCGMQPCSQGSQFGLLQCVQIDSTDVHGPVLS